VKQYIFVGIIAPCFILIPLVAGFAHYRFLNREFKVIIYYLLTTALANAVAKILIVFHFHNLFIIHVYTVIEALFLCWLFILILPDYKIQITIRFLAILFPAFCLVNFVFFQNSTVLNTYTRPVEAIIFIALSMCYWWKNNNMDYEVSWANYPLNWIVSGLLLYFSSAFFLFVFSNLLAFSYSTAVNVFIWNIHAVILIVMYLFFAMGFYKCKR
jgi:hypothetical protein